MSAAYGFSRSRFLRGFMLALFAMGIVGIFMWSGGQPAFGDPPGDITFFDDESSIPSTFADFDKGFDLDKSGSVAAGSAMDVTVLPVRMQFTLVGGANPRTLTLDYFLVEDASR